MTGGQSSPLNVTFIIFQAHAKHKLPSQLPCCYCSASGWRALSPNPYIGELCKVSELGRQRAAPGPLNQRSAWCWAALDRMRKRKWPAGTSSLSRSLKHFTSLPSSGILGRPCHLTPHYFAACFCPGQCSK